MNRYSYCVNNPLIYVDPSGYDEVAPDDEWYYDENDFPTGIRPYASDTNSTWLPEISVTSGTSCFANTTFDYTWAPTISNNSFMYDSSNSGPVSSPGSSQTNVIDQINWVVGGGGTVSGILGNATHNELWWVTKNGQFKWVLGLTQKTSTSYEIVGKSLASLKVCSSVFAGAGGILTVTNVYINKQVNPSDVINGFMCSISFTGAGSLIAGGYYAVDFGAKIFTGTSIGERMDKAWGPVYKWD